MTASNPFPVPTPLQQKRLEQIVKIAALTYSRGWNAGTAGNFSVRGSNGILWQSPSGVPKGKMQSRQFIPVSIASCQSIWPVSPRPSAEMPLHAGIYRELPWVNAVVHVHPPHAVRASKDRAQLSFVEKEMNKAFGVDTHETEIVVPIIPNTQDMLNLGASVAQHLKPGLPVLLLREHGIYAFGKEPQDALNLIESLEYLCQTAF